MKWEALHANHTVRGLHWYDMPGERAIKKLNWFLFRRGLLDVDECPMRKGIRQSIARAQSNRIEKEAKSYD